MTDLDRPVTRRELREELKAFTTKDDLKAFATKDDLFRVRDELRTHFDLVAESFKGDFAMLCDWAEANATGLAARVEDIETGHRRRLLALETRVSRIERAKGRMS